MPSGQLFDTHCHLADPELTRDIDGVLERAQAAAVTGITAIATNLADSYHVAKLAQEHAPRVYCSVGIHPNECHTANGDQWKKIQTLAQSPRVVALGETGLDLYWKTTPLELQKTWLKRHIELSHEIGKPIVVHMRECESEVIQFLQAHAREGKIHGIMHSYTGTIEGARACLELGMYISFAGMVTFKNAGDIREVAQQIPDDRILVETDAPYLTPAPHRGKRPNEPAMVRHTAECLAEIRGQSFDEFADHCTDNAKQLFGIAD